MFTEYIVLFIFCFTVFVLACIILLMNYLFIYQQNYLEKITAYECGFQPFEFGIVDFNIRYYLLAILFLLFDVEIIFLIPYLAADIFIHKVGVGFFICFLILLVFGFYYEGKKGGLNWD